MKFLHSGASKVVDVFLVQCLVDLQEFHIISQKCRIKQAEKVVMVPHASIVKAALSAFDIKQRASSD